MMRNPPRVELIYDQDCPNIDGARAMIRAALDEIGADMVWTEWDRAGATTPAAFRHYGSPTVLIDGRDVGCDENETAPADAKACRVYMDECGCLSGAPSARLIVNAIRRVPAA